MKLKQIICNHKWEWGMGTSIGFLGRIHLKTNEEESSQYCQKCTKIRWVKEVAPLVRIQRQRAKASGYKSLDGKKL